MGSNKSLGLSYNSKLQNMVYLIWNSIIPVDSIVILKIYRIEFHYLSLMIEQKKKNP